MSIRKKVDGEIKEVANKSIIDHSQLTNRDAYGAHPISAIRKLPEKLYALKEKNDKTQKDLDEHKTAATEKFAELDAVNERQDKKDQEIISKVDYVEQHSQQIKTTVDNELKLKFRNYDGESKTFRTGYLPDNINLNEEPIETESGEITYEAIKRDELEPENEQYTDDATLTLDEDNKLTLRKIHSKDTEFVGLGTKENPLELKNKADEDTIVVLDSDEKVTQYGGQSINTVQAIAIKDNKGKIDLEYIRSHERANEEEFAAVREELEEKVSDLNKHDEAQDAKILELQTRTNGMGGWLNAYNFGKKDLTKKDLNQYAVQDIGEITEIDIYDGTRVKNLFDNNVWVYDKQTDSWQNIGPDNTVAIATDDYLGVVRSSDELYKGSVDVAGIISINGLEDKLDNIDNKFNEYVTLETEQNISGAKTFEEDVTLNKNLNIDGNINPTDNTLNIDGTVKPTENNTYDLGSQTEQYKDLYLAGNLSNGNKSINIEYIADIDDVQALSDIGLKYKGDYVAESPYDIYDVVKYQNYYFLSLLKENTNEPSLENDINWKCLNRYSINSEKVKVVEEPNTKAYLVSDKTESDDFSELHKDYQVYSENGELYDKRGVVASKEYVNEQISTVTSDSQEVNAQLRSDLDEEIRNRETADNDIKASLEGEIAYREAGDSNLQQKLNEEIADRTSGDQTLTDALNQEITNRTEALEALEKKVNDEIQVKLDEQANKLDKEIQDRADADTYLQTNIDNEISARETKDTELEEKINQEVTNRTDADTEINTRIDNLKTSDLENDGDGSSPFATRDYVDKFGGKIDSISINGEPQTIDENKNVDLTIPTKTSELTNDGDGEPDSKYATEEYVIDLVSNNTSRYLTASADTDVMSAIFDSLDAVKAGPWYRNGKETQPTNNDYATFEYHRMVEGSEIPQHEYWKAIYQVDYETGEGVWSAQCKLGSMLTLEQQKALDSGITSTLVSQITTNKNDIESIKTKDTQQDTNIKANTDNITNLTTTVNNLETNLETNYYTKQETYSQTEVNELLKNVSAITIRRWA